MGTVEGRQVVEAVSHTNVPRPQGRFLDCQRTSKKGLGRGIVALVAVESCQVIEALGYDWMMRPQYRLADRQGPMVERRSLLMFALRVVEVR